MRVILEKGKQKEIIQLARKNKSWGELSILLNLRKSYLQRDIFNERISISKENYDLLCHIINDNYDKFIIRIAEDNWGRRLGGKNSTGNTKQINISIKKRRYIDNFGNQITFCPKFSNTTILFLVTQSTKLSISKYLKEIGFSNNKHKNRLIKLAP